MKNILNEKNVRSLLSMSLMALAIGGLTACGGGGGGTASADGNTASANGSASTVPVPPPAATSSADTNLPEGKLQWAISTSITVKLKDAAGNQVAGNLSCVSKDATALEISSDCKTAKALRIGSHAFTVSNGSLSADVTVKNIPQRHPLAAAARRIFGGAIIRPRLRK
jgi:hypothetical protein